MNTLNVVGSVVLALFVGFIMPREMLAQSVAEPADQTVLQPTVVTTHGFNPFLVQQYSRFTVGRLGFPTTRSISRQSWLDSQFANEPIPVATAPPPVDVSSTVDTSAAVEEETVLTESSSARPPFRPRVRSPFRPAPRPPF